MAKKRSPAYPAIDLEAAIRRAKALYDKEHDNRVPVATVLAHWKYSENSGAGMATVAALKQFGLLAEQKDKSGRHVKLTDLALDIILDERPDSEKRLAAIRQAALNPKIYSEMRSEWGGKKVSDPTIRHFLVRAREFNPTIAGSLIQDYRATMEFAFAEEGVIIEDKDAEGVQVGDLVQWESQGVAQFPEPRRVTGFSDDADYVFVDGTVTGIEIDQVTVVQREKGEPATNIPPKVPPLAPVALPLPVLMGDGSYAIVSIPKMTQTAFKFFKDQLEAYAAAIVVPDPTQEDNESNGE